MVGKNMTKLPRWTIAFNMFTVGVLRENDVAPIEF